MAYNVISTVIMRLGFCCHFAYFTATRHTATSDIALELGVHKRTARRWRAACRDRCVECEGKSGCCLTKEKG